MNRLNGTEKAALGLAAVFLAFGLWMVFSPQEMVICHPGTRYAPGNFIEHVSKRGARVYGALSLSFGGGFVLVAICGTRNRR